MGLFQKVYLVRQRGGLPDAGVVYVDLPVNEVLSGLVVNFQVTNTTSVNRARSIFDVVTDVRVLLEGSKVAYAAPPALGSFLAFLQSGYLPPHYPRDLASSATGMVLPILFGRWMNDQEYALDTSRYAHAQLQIAYALNTTYEATGSAQVTVWALRPLTRFTPRGFIRSRMVYERTTSGAAETVEFSLPVGLNWYSVGIRCFDADRTLTGNVTWVTLDVDGGRLLLVDNRIEDVVDHQSLLTGAPITGYPIPTSVANGNTQQTFMDVQTAVGVTPNVGINNFFAVTDMSGQQATIAVTDTTGGAVTTARAVTVQPQGVCPFGGLLVYDGRENPFPASTYSEAKLVLTHAAYVNLIQGFVQEVVEGGL
jgi:hypothetical protein